MEIRYITPDEAVDFLKVSAASFIWKFNKDEDKEVEMPVLAAFSEGKLIAGVEVFDFKTNYCGNILNSVIASGVCSLPESRRMGGIREIFRCLGESAVENDVTLGFLQPFSISYYEKFGYANLNRLFAIRIPFENMKHIPRNTDVILYTGEQLEELCTLHNKCALRENLVSLRYDKKHFCDSPLENADYTYFRRNKNGEADGYVRFTVKRPTEVVVEELFYLTPEALYGLLGFLRNYDGITKQLLIRKQTVNSPVALLADKISDVTYDYNGGAAGRIYNLKKLLESNLYPEDYGSFRLKCSDEFSQNNGVFEVEYQNGKCMVTKKDTSGFDISLTELAAARLLLAGEGHTKETAVFIDGVELNKNTDGFFRAFPYRPTRFFDSCWSE